MLKKLAKEIYEYDDVDFAELFVWINVIRKEKNIELMTKEEMKNFDEKEFCKWLQDVLREIIHDEDIDSYAWWKQ